MSASLNNKLRDARSLLQAGDAATAQAICSEILDRAPRNPEALTLRGIASLMNGAHADAARDLRLALNASPHDGATLEYLGLALLNLGQPAEAERVLKRAAMLPGAPVSVRLRLGLAMLHQGRATDAATPLRQALQLAPGDPDCLLALGQALAAAGDSSAAAAQFEILLQADPDHLDARFNLGVLALSSDDLVTARRHFENVLGLAPQHADAMVNLGIILDREGQTAAAQNLLRQAVAITPSHPHAHNNLGRMALQAGHQADARRHFEAALAAAPALPVALEGMGAVARAQGRYGEAVRWLRELTRHEPASATAWVALGDSLLQVGELEAAESAANRASDLDNRLEWPYSLRAQLHILRGELGAAIAILDEGYRKTTGTALLGMLTQYSRHACDWPRWTAAWAAFKPQVIQCVEAGTPFALLGEDLTGAELVAYTRAWAGRRFGDLLDAPPGAHGHGDSDRRLRIGYLSSDFQEHPAAYLITEVLELHDRTRFEVYAYSHGPRDDGAMRQRIIAAVDHFVDIAWESDDQAIARIRNDQIDILVDLKGYTVGDRLNIMAHRPSPVQVTWLGYPGTTGTRFMDYIIADPYIVPPGTEQICSETVLRMPHCYQPTDRRRVIATPLTRQAYGLPEQGTVFCCFNQTFKITPEVFDAWMRILRAVPDSVLWLVDGNPLATAHLREAATAAGVNPQRLVFAPRVALSEHLARYRIADLALDTYPYTSHTTASDALWCGCPLIALSGETFAARVSGSILSAAGLPDLIATSLPEYESKAVALALDPATRRIIAERVDSAKSTAALFDSTAFARDLEALYAGMHARSPSNA